MQLVAYFWGSNDLWWYDLYHGLWRFFYWWSVIHFIKNWEELRRSYTKQSKYRQADGHWRRRSLAPEAMVTMIRNFCNGSSGINWRRLDKAQNSFFFFKNRNIFAKNWSISKRLIFRAIKDYQIPNVAPKPMVTFAKES